MQVFIIHFNFPPLSCESSKKIPLLFWGRGWRRENSVIFMNLACQASDSPIRRAERRDKERGRLKARRIAIAAEGNIVD